ncbi:MAG: PAS domain-containing protein, partial [Ignavibacteriales bacterium]|nr:PAS domain-containing protein [Ignavibacteriales bacterium]
MPISLLSKVSFFPVLISAVQNSPVSIIITDADANLLYVNPQFTRVTGYTSDEILGKNARVRRSDKTAPEVLQSLSEAFHNGQPWSGELWNLKKSGEMYLESVVIAPIRDSSGE